MARLTKQTTGGGFQPFFVSVLASGVLTIGMPFLGAPMIIGIAAWPLLYVLAKNGVREELEEEFPDEIRDRIAETHFSQGGRSVDIERTSWSDATIPLPRKLKTKYRIED